MFPFSRLFFLFPTSEIKLFIYNLDISNYNPHSIFFLTERLGFFQKDFLSKPRNYFFSLLRSPSLTIFLQSFMGIYLNCFFFMVMFQADFRPILLWIPLTRMYYIVYCSTFLALNFVILILVELNINHKQFVLAKLWMRAYLIV